MRFYNSLDFGLIEIARVAAEAHLLPGQSPARFLEGFPA
jgi:hypothetical protein